MLPRMTSFDCDEMERHFTWSGTKSVNGTLNLIGNGLRNFFLFFGPENTVGHCSTVIHSFIHLFFFGRVT